MLAIVTNGLGGLGLFFAGMYLLSENLKRLTGARFRETVAAWTRRQAAGLVWGFAAGAVLQSTSAVTFVVVSMLASGLLLVESALPIIIGCNVGSTLLVIIAALDINVFVLILLGIAGISFASQRLAPTRTFAMAAFGVGLVFLGLHMIQIAAEPLAAEPWVERTMRFAGASYLLMFAIATGLSILTQSSNSIALIAITLATAGVLSFEDAVMAVYGANVGSSVLTYLLSAGLRGRQRQVAMYQVAFNYVAAIVLIPLFYVEVYSGIPMVRLVVSAMTGDVTLQLAYVHLVFNVVGAIVLIPLIGPAARLLARRYPPAPEEEDARPQYLYDQAVEEPETALDLVTLEQRRLAGYLPRLLAIARDAPSDATARIARQREVFGILGGTIATFLDRIGNAPISHSGYERLNQALVIQGQLDGLDETLADLAQAVVAAGENPGTRRLAGNIVEGLDAVLLTAIEAMSPDGTEDRQLLAMMTGDRSELMRRLREEYLASDAELGANEKMAVLTVTNLAERASWLLGRMARALLESDTPSEAA